ncbi:MAG: enoyl-CoA hydratase [Candidatus Puniceispirillum sp.]
MDAGGDTILLSELSDTGVLRLTLNDPSRRNALSEKMMAAIQSTLDTVADDTAVRVIVLASHGPAFCAGHDLKELTAGRAADDGGKAYFTDIMAQCSAMMQTIVRHPKPVIAEVRGIATAAGCQLVASCDLAYAAHDAKFSTPGVHIGLFCSTPMVALSRNIAPKHAMEMLLTGDMVNATRAVEMGLVNAACAEDELTDAVLAVAAKIASKSSMTVKTGKRAFYEQAEMSLADAYDYAAAIMVDNMLKRDAEEGVNAFLEKRDAVWHDE